MQILMTAAYGIALSMAITFVLYPDKPIFIYDLIKKWELPFEWMSHGLLTFCLLYEIVMSFITLGLHVIIDSTLIGMCMSLTITLQHIGSDNYNENVTNHPNKLILVIF